LRITVIKYAVAIEHGSAVFSGESLIEIKAAVLHEPGMAHDLRNRNSVFRVSSQHSSNQVFAVRRERHRESKLSS
jgi:hypothetical protein